MERGGLESIANAAEAETQLSTGTPPGHPLWIIGLSYPQGLNATGWSLRVPRPMDNCVFPSGPPQEAVFGPCSFAQRRQAKNCCTPDSPADANSLCKEWAIAKPLMIFPSTLSLGRCQDLFLSTSLFFSQASRQSQDRKRSVKPGGARQQHSEAKDDLSTGRSLLLAREGLATAPYG